MRLSGALSRLFVDQAEEFVRRRTGLVFGETRRSAFESGLVRAMHQARLPQADVYLEHLHADPALLDRLVAEITVGETYFFRDPQQFDLIRDEVVPALAPHRRGEQKLRIWSAGCATGEEAYTLAIVLRECGLAESAHITATDISRTALSQAGRGLYGRRSLRGVSDRIQQTYFRPAGERFQLASELRQAVEFRYLNLAEDAYPSTPTGIWGMDLILCRNVLIYFDAQTVARVARRLIDSLSDDGWLLLGASDPSLRDLVPCDVVVTAAGLVYRRHGRSATPSAAVPGLPSALTPLLEPPRAMQPAPQPELASPLAPTPVVPPPQASEDAAHAAGAYAERDYQRAAELAGRSLRHDGNDPALWIVLVRALANRGDLKAAGQACAAALDRHRTSVELNYLHAVLLAAAGRHREAAGAARRALYLDRGLVVAHLALGGALARLGDTNAARRANQTAQGLLAAMAPQELVPASDGEPACRLAEMARVQMQLLQEPAA